MKGVKLAAQFITTEAKKEFRTQGAADPKSKTGFGALGEPIAGKLTTRTGALRASIRMQIRENQVAALVGPTKKYGHIHEVGFTGSEDVKAHSRRYRAMRGVKAGFVDTTVKAHKRMMKMPARPYLKPAFVRNRQRIREIMAKPIIEAWRKTK
jgi:phage gpG-like protein